MLVFFKIRNYYSSYGIRTRVQISSERDVGFSVETHDCASYKEQNIRDAQSHVSTNSTIPRLSSETAYCTISHSYQTIREQYFLCF